MAFPRRVCMMVGHDFSVPFRLVRLWFTMTPRHGSANAAQPPIRPRTRRSYAYESAGRGKRALHCEGVALARIADAVGTPAYVYSRASIEAAYRGLDRAFGSLPHTLCYA